MEAFPGAVPLLVDEPEQLGWWMTDDALLCFAVIGDDAGTARVSTARTFEWCAREHAVVEGADPWAAIPLQLRAGHTGGRIVHVFVRAAREDAFTYIGTSAAIRRQPRKQRTRFVMFDLDRTIPSDVLRRLSVLGPERDHSSLDARLPLAAQLSASERIDLARELAEWWRGPSTEPAGAAHSDGTIPIPPTLQWWFDRIGPRRDLFLHNQLLDADTVHYNQGQMTFLVENGASWELVFSGGDDPAVWACIFPDEYLSAQNMPLSLALLGALMFEFVLAAPYGARAVGVAAADVEWLASHLTEVRGLGFSLAEMPSRVFVGNGAFAAVLPNWPNFDIRVGAMRETAVQFLGERAGLWEWAAF